MRALGADLGEPLLDETRDDAGRDAECLLQVGDVGRVLDGDVDEFIKTYLMQKASGTLGTAAAGDED